MHSVTINGKVPSFLLQSDPMRLEDHLGRVTARRRATNSPAKTHAEAIGMGTL